MIGITIVNVYTLLALAFAIGYCVCNAHKISWPFTLILVLPAALGIVLTLLHI